MGLVVGSPRAPREHGWLLVGLGAPPHPSWHAYLGAAR